MLLSLEEPPTKLKVTRKLRAAVHEPGLEVKTEKPLNPLEMDVVKQFFDFDKYYSDRPDILRESVRTAESLKLVDSNKQLSLETEQEKPREMIG
jgi:hypothetical protein